MKLIEYRTIVVLLMRSKRSNQNLDNRERDGQHAKYRMSKLGVTLFLDPFEFLIG